MIFCWSCQNHIGNPMIESQWCSSLRLIKLNLNCFEISVRLIVIFLSFIYYELSIRSSNQEASWIVNDARNRKRIHRTFNNHCFELTSRFKKQDFSSICAHNNSSISLSPVVACVFARNWRIFVIDLSVVSVKLRVIFYFVVFEHIWSSYANTKLVIRVEWDLKWANLWSCYTNWNWSQDSYLLPVPK